MARIAIETANKHAEIKQALESVCYTEAELAKGADLLAKATKAFHGSLNESNESSAAYKKFSQEEEKLADMYSDDRTKAKVIFRTDVVAKHDLELDTFQPRTYDRWVLSVENFYKGSPPRVCKRTRRIARRHQGQEPSHWRTGPLDERFLGGGSHSTQEQASVAGVVG